MTVFIPSRNQLEALLQLTGAGLDKDEDVEFISYHMNYAVQSVLVSTAKGASKNEIVGLLALKCLINLVDTDDRVQLLATILGTSFSSFLNQLLLLATNSQGEEGDLTAGLLANITRRLEWAEKVANEVDLGKMVYRICSGVTKQSQHHLARVLVNLTQSAPIRTKLCDPSSNLIRRLGMYMETSFSEDLRSAVVAVVKNCTFDDDHHEYLLGPDVEILTALLTPLCGPEDAIDEEDTSQLPPAVQKVTGQPNTLREPCPEIRIMLCEALLQICSTEFGRGHLKSNGAYFVLREMHRKEADRAVLLSIERVVDILIGDEAAPGARLRVIDLPDSIGAQTAAAEKIFFDN